MNYDDLFQLAVKTHVPDMSVSKEKTKEYEKYFEIVISELLQLLAPYEWWGEFIINLGYSIISGKKDYALPINGSKIETIKEVKTGRFFKNSNYTTIVRRVTRSEWNYLLNVSNEKDIVFLHPGVNNSDLPEKAFINIYDNIHEYEQNKTEKLVISAVRSFSTLDASSYFAYLDPKYVSLIFNGFLVWLYRAIPGLQSSMKENLAIQLWEEGKKQILKEKELENQVSRDGGF